MTDVKKPVRCVAVVQCHVSHERCCGVHCAASFAKREHRFSGYGAEAIFYVPFSCGGCPGRRVPRLATNLMKMMKGQGVGTDEIVVHLASCMVTDNFHYPPCPHLKDIEKMLKRRGLAVVKGSYVSKQAEARRQSGEYER